MNLKGIWEFLVGDEEETVINSSMINRFEVIDQTGRVVVRYVEPNETFSVSVQDNGSTLKVFILDKNG